jgi:hypothetical protein
LVDDGGIITIPETVLPFPVNTVVQNLQALVNPMGTSSNYGLDLFEDAVSFLSQVSPENI